MEKCTILLTFFGKYDNLAHVADLNYAQLLIFICIIVTYVNQEVYLFHDSLYNNLVFGCKDVDYEKLGQVCELTGVSEIIESFTEGMAHILSAGGKDLSGGQRQKIALARALMRDTPIYIFDESSSNMDSDSEEMFINLINEYLSLKTVIVISHREKFKNYVDKVYRIERGTLC